MTFAAPYKPGTFALDKSTGSGTADVALAYQGAAVQLLSSKAGSATLKSDKKSGKVEADLVRVTVGGLASDSLKAVHAEGSFKCGKVKK